MGPCTLQIGHRVVLVSYGGPPLAELSLFEPSDLELAASDGGAVREAGYRTHAFEARRRLAALGATLAVAEEAAQATAGVLAPAYARGPIARRVAPKLGPAELFDGATFDGALQRYDGRWIDLPRVANDAGLASGTPLLQALGLAAFLAEVPDDTPVVLSTRAYTEGARPGERSLRKVPLEGVTALPRVLLRYASTLPAPAVDTVPGLTREEIVGYLRDRVQTAPSQEVRDHLIAIERGLERRKPPMHGPLASPDLWAIEMQLDDGDVIGVIERLESFERTRGRQPGSTYLRARAALLLGRESPRGLAERVSEMVLSMNEFPELQLLAAQAWMAAGEPRRGLPYARDLLESYKVHPDLKTVAEAIVNPRGRSLEARPPAPAEKFTEMQWEPTEAGTLRKASPIPRTDPSPQRPPAQPDEPPPARARAMSPVPPAVRKLTPPPIPAIVIPSPRHESPLPPPPTQASGAAPPHAPRSGRRSSPPPVASRGPSSDRPSDRMIDRGDRISDPEVRPSQWPASLPPPREEPYRPEHVDHTPSSPPVSKRFMKGASLPPYQSEPPQRVPYQPIIPRVDVEDAELVETLTMPPRAQDEMTRGAQMPQTPLEARVRCTLAARQLARHYRTELSIELRMNEEAVQTMQRHLRASFPSRTIRTLEEAREAQLHGALLSEVLARTLGAEWVDVAPTEFGYWAMVVPTSDGRGKRVWPFGRVLRFIATGGVEDLTGYYKKLRELR